MRIFALKVRYRQRVAADQERVINHGPGTALSPKPKGLATSHCRARPADFVETHSSGNAPFGRPNLYLEYVHALKGESGGD